MGTNTHKEVIKDKDIQDRTETNINIQTNTQMHIVKDTKDTYKQADT